MPMSLCQRIKARRVHVVFSPSGKELVGINTDKEWKGFVVEKLTEVGISPEQVNQEGSHETRTQRQIPSHPKTQKYPPSRWDQSIFPKPRVIPTSYSPVLPHGRNPQILGVTQGPQSLLGASGTANTGPEAETMLSIPPKHGYPTPPA